MNVLVGRIGAEVPRSEVAFLDAVMECGSVEELGEVLCERFPDEAADLEVWQSNVLALFINRDDLVRSTQKLLMGKVNVPGGMNYQEAADELPAPRLKPGDIVVLWDGKSFGEYACVEDAFADIRGREWMWKDPRDHNLDCLEFKRVVAEGELYDEKSYGCPVVLLGNLAEGLTR